MLNLINPAVEVFKILQSYDYEVIMYGPDSNRVTDPADATRFFVSPDNIMVSIVDDGENSAIRLLLGKSININDIMGLIQALRTAANIKYNLGFTIRRHGGDISPREIATNSGIDEAADKDHTMKILEGLYGTSRSSYLKLPRARMIVRHSEKIDETKFGARSRLIETILIENASGERFLFPTTNLLPARAMTQHVNQGGTFADQIGQQIFRMAQDYKNLSTCSRHIYSHAGDLVEGAQTVREACRSSIASLRKTFHRLSRESGYAAESVRIAEQDSLLIETKGQDGIAADRISALQEMLNLEGAELAPEVLECACKAVDGLHRRDGEDEMIEERQAPQMVSVLGQRVSSPAWEEFRAGHLRLDRTPEDFAQTSFPSKTAEMEVKLSEVASCAADDTMSNLLSHVAEALKTARDPKLLRTLRAIGLRALSAAGQSLDANIPQTGAVREFAEWVSSFGLNQLAEDDADMEMPVDETELTREDVLLPSDDVADSFAREVTSPTVKDPATGKTEEPNASYVTQLRATSDIGKFQSY